MCSEGRDEDRHLPKRLADAYAPDTLWRKIRNPVYTQMAGRRELFHPT